MSDGYLYAVCWVPAAGEPPRLYGAVPGRIDAFSARPRVDLLADVLRAGRAAAAVSVTSGEIAELDKRHRGNSVRTLAEPPVHGSRDPCAEAESRESPPPRLSRDKGEPLPDPRAALVHLLVRHEDLLVDDMGRPLVAGLRPVDLVALHLDQLGIDGVLRESDELSS